MAGYNITRSIDELLAEHESSPPSFTVHLHPDHWTLNSGSKFLYNNQLASLLDDIRSQRIPTDFLELFEAAKLPFYEGCMIVELLDYRPLKGKEPELSNPKRSRVVLSPTPETMWADICLLNHKAGNTWTDEDTLQVEAKILLATSPPLCLDPDPHLARIANSIMRVSAPPAPASLKRKAAAMEPEEDESEKVRRAKIMQYMNPRTNRSTIPSYRILEVLEKVKSRPPPAASNPPTQVMPPTMPPTQPPTIPTSYPLGKRTTPAPPSNPIPAPLAAPAHILPQPTQRKSATPAPQIVSSPPAKPATAAEVRKAATQSPVINARPPSAVPSAAAAIPPHMHQYQTARSTPSPPSHNTPHIPHPRPASTAAPTLPTERPQSAAQPQMNGGQHLQPQPLQQARGRTPMPQHTPSPRTQSGQTPHLQPIQPPQAQLQPHQPQPHPQMQSAQTQPQILPQPNSIPQQQQPGMVQNPNMVNMPNIASRRKTPQLTAPAAAQMSQQQGQMGQQQGQMHPAYYQLLMQQQQQSQARNAAAAAMQQRGVNVNSPAARATQATPRPAAAVPQQMQQGGFNYAALAAQQNHMNNAGLRPVVHTPHQQLMQQQQQQQHQFQAAQAAAGGTQAGPQQLVQDQQAAAAAAQAQAHAQAQAQAQQAHMQNPQFTPQQQYQMYTYQQQQMNLQMQQQRYQWQMGINRGMVPNIAGHPQQMQLGAGKAGMQGSS